MYTKTDDLKRHVLALAAPWRSRLSRWRERAARWCREALARAAGALGDAAATLEYRLAQATS